MFVLVANNIHCMVNKTLFDLRPYNSQFLAHFASDKTNLVSDYLNCLTRSTNQLLNKEKMQFENEFLCALC